MKFTQENLEETSALFHNILFNDKNGEVCRRFLLDRGIDDLDLLFKYEIGYCPPCYPYPSSQSLYLDNRLWWLRGRMIITIRDQHNRIISFAGRVIDSNKDILKTDLFNKIDTPLLSYLNGDIDKLQKMIDDWSSRKWVNEFYSKKDYLFGLNKAKKYIFDMGYVIIVEGYMDAILLWENGFPNTVALCGVAMSDMHIALLHRYTNHFVYCLDKDTGGQTAMKKIEKFINNKYFDLQTYYAIYLPEGMDPEDTLMNDEHKKVFINVIKEAGKRNNISFNGRHIDIEDKIVRQIYSRK